MIMDIQSVTITQEEIERELARATPAEPAGAFKKTGVAHTDVSNRHYR